MSERIPTVSVIMPVYNARRYVRQAVTSITAQTGCHFELIVIDDGSTDGSTDILRGLAARDSRIWLVSRPNTGYTTALNEALGLARGRYIARMDADDVALPGRLALQAAELDARPDLAALGSAIWIIDPAGRRVMDYRPPTQHVQIEAALLSGQAVINHPSVMMRASAVRAVGGYDPQAEPSEDVDLFLRLTGVGRLANLPERMLCYRLHPHSVSQTRSARQLETLRRVCERAARDRGVRSTFCGPGEWRPAATRRSIHAYAMRCGWWAFRQGDRGTALVYASRAVRTGPGDAEAWRLLACAALKPMRGSTPAAALGEVGAA